MADSTFHQVMPSTFAAMREVQGKLMEMIVQHGFDDEAQFAIKLALEEGLINAIKHGNKSDPEKKVTVDSKVSDARAEFIIHDEGEGFIRKKVPDPTKRSNREKSSGRGLLLIEAYMTQVEYSDGGRRLKIVFEKKS